MKKPIAPKRPIFNTQVEQYLKDTEAYIKDCEVYEEYCNRIKEVKEELVNTIIEEKSIEVVEKESTDILSEIKAIVENPAKKKVGRKPKKGSN
jgi:hypothetical protein